VDDGRKGKAETLKVESRNGEHRTSNIEHRMKGGFTLQEQTEIAEVLQVVLSLNLVPPSRSFGATGKSDHVTTEILKF
jgi:hypothetical protein